MTDFFGFKKPNSVICLILSQSFFPCLTLVLYGYLIKFHFLIGFSPQSFFLPFFLFVCPSLYINKTSALDVFSESPLITAIRMVRTPRHFSQLSVSSKFYCSFFLKSKMLFYSFLFPNIFYSEKQIDARSQHCQIFY